MTFGAEQEWLNWALNDNNDGWIVRKTARANLSLSPRPQWTLATGLLHDLNSNNPSESLGIEFSVRWIPGA